MIKKNFLVFGSMAVMGLAFMSCSKDLYSEDAVNELQDATYAANFEKRYGKIDPNQTWDFTTGVATYSTGSSGSSTRAVASVADADFHRVEKVILSSQQSVHGCLRIFQREKIILEKEDHSLWELVKTTSLSCLSSRAAQATTGSCGCM